MGCWFYGPDPTAKHAVSPLPGANRMEQLVESIAERVVNLVLDAVDINALVAQIDMDAVLAKVDVDAIVSKVDVQKIIDRVDVDEIVARVDVDAIIDRVDVQHIIERVDVQEIVQRVDIDSLVEQTELGTIIARSTSGVASEVLDVVRAQGVGLDDFVARWVNRVLRRTSAEWPAGPLGLIAQPPADVPALTAEVAR